MTLFQQLMVGLAVSLVGSLLYDRGSKMVGSLIPALLRAAARRRLKEIGSKSKDDYRWYLVGKIGARLPYLLGSVTTATLGAALIMAAFESPENWSSPLVYVRVLTYVGVLTYLGMSFIAARIVLQIHGAFNNLQESADFDNYVASLRSWVDDTELPKPQRASQ